MKIRSFVIFAAICAAISLPGCAGTMQGAKADISAATTVAEPAPDPSKVKSLLDKLVNVDAPAAIARAQKLIDNPKTSPEEVIYAQKRIVCYQTIVEIAPNFHLLDLPQLGGQSSGVLDRFEIGAETVEGVKAAGAIGLPKVDKAKFETACGWIKQRAEVIAGGLGLRVGAVGSGLGFLLPK